MTLLRRLTLGLRALARPDLAERETADEVEHYLREAAAAHLALGLSEQEALRAARLELGSPATDTAPSCLVEGHEPAAERHCLRRRRRLREQEPWDRG